ncbi:MAG: hypothetical protein CEN87_307 [Parcubacteria group bacterium Licking1014_1]|nr:MAG: hypothetical protein CEN87_307 [Parcubacteria group bacterium Licking1014_1]
MNYEKLIEDGLLKREEIGFDKVQKLVEKARQKIKSAYILIKNDDLDNGFQFAYEAMLFAGRALVFSYGLRPRTSGSHKIVVQFCGEVLGGKYKDLVGKFDKARADRNYLIYGVGLTISSTEADNAIKTAQNFIKIVEEYIEKKNPQVKLLKNRQ